MMACGCWFSALRGRRAKQKHVWDESFVLVQEEMVEHVPCFCWTNVLLLVCVRCGCVWPFWAAIMPNSANLDGLGHPNSIMKMKMFHDGFC